MALFDMTLGEFLGKLSSGDPTPGGGAASALAASMSAALVSMVANVTLVDRDYMRSHDKARNTITRCDELRARFAELAEDEAIAFNGYTRALAMPKDTRANKAARESAICEAAKNAALVPLDMLDLCVECGALAAEASQRWSAAARSDAIEAALLARAAALAAVHNVRANMAFTKDDAFNRETENHLRRAIDAVTNSQEEAESMRR